MREFFKSIFFKVLLGIIAVFLGFILYEASTGNISSPSQLLSVISSPFQRAASAVSDGIDNILAPVMNAKAYQKENKELREQIAELNEKLIDYENLKEENKQLREIADIKKINEDFKLVPATIIARESDPFGTFHINAGKLHGISVGDPVIISNGSDGQLVGKISSVGQTYAYVMTVINPDFYVTGYDVKTNESGTINGEISLAEDGYCRMLYLDKGTKIEKGSLIVTSGSSGVFPAELQIGNVLRLEVQENGISSYAVLKPLVNPDNITSVMVLTDFTGKGVVEPAVNSEDSSSQESSASGGGESQ